METDQREALKQVKAFTFKREYCGHIPSDVFYAVVAMSVSVGAALGSPLMAAVYLISLGVPMYFIHKNDPFALKIWIRAMKRRHTRWCSGVAVARELIIFDKEVDDEFH